MGNSVNIMGNSVEFYIGFYMWAVLSPILLTLGTVGNIMTIVVWSRRDMRSSQATVYLIALSVADILVLNAGLLRHFIREICGFDIRKLSEASCKINTMLVYTSLDVSVWILVAFTFERILSVYMPHKVKRYCTRMTSLFVIASIVVVFVALNSHFLYGTGNVYIAITENMTLVLQCGPMTDDYGRFLFLTWPWIDFCVFSLVPIFIISVGNTCIVVRVWTSRRKTLGLDPMSTTTSSTKSTQENQAETENRLPKRNLKLHRSSSMTAIVMVLNIMFLVTTTPVSLFFIVMPTWKSHAATEQDMAQIYLTFAVVNLIQYINNSCNFIMYCMAGSKFRLVFRGIFHRKRVYPIEACQELRQYPYENRNPAKPILTELLPQRLSTLKSLPTIYINDVTVGTCRRLTDGEIR
ncbi:thyrotropin-releasing hormone receptor-like [Biomphalaria glabrata]|uniref:Thyrotropin-releasing hormone receptor-like n=2 Tax=Biomphalaria TaxID=6525 RepID=A0A9W2Z965_BIOGL|nr:thyrotropin-releasing hormone receptor-like [Biomphalaria glabrata]